MLRRSVLRGRFFAVLALIFIVAFQVSGQEPECPDLSGKEQLSMENESPSKTLIDMPTAAALERGEYDFEFRIYPNGGILGGFTVGLFKRFNMGIYFGGTDVISDKPAVEWNKEPGVLVKYRLFEECRLLPALALGFCNQGYGFYNDSLNRYLVKSKGLFVAASKNLQYLPHRDLGIHGAVNYNTTEQDDDEDFNFTLGADLYLNEELALVAEYDFAYNDDEENSFGSGDGYFNAGIRWTFARHLLFQFHFRDIFDNSKFSDSPSREIKIVYIEDI